MSWWWDNCTEFLTEDSISVTELLEEDGDWGYSTLTNNSSRIDYLGSFICAAIYCFNI